MVVLHYELVVSTLRRRFFLGVCGFFLRNVDGYFGDVEWRKVKRYLFSKPHFFYFWTVGEDERGWERRGERMKEDGRGIGEP